MKTKITLFSLAAILFGILQQSHAQEVLLETSTAQNPKWYIMKSIGVTGDTHNRIAKVVTYLPHHANKGVKGIDLTSFATINDSILWRFEVNPNDPTKMAIISKYDNSSISGTLETTSISGTTKLAVCKAGTAYDWTVSSVTDKVRSNTTYKCYSFTNSSTSPATLFHMAGSGLQWWFNSYNDDAIFYYLLNDNYFSTTSTNQSEAVSVKVVVENKRVRVIPANSAFQLYSMDGVKMDATKELKTGVYMVKSGHFTTKVLVK